MRYSEANSKSIESNAVLLESLIFPLSKYGGGFIGRLGRNGPCSRRFRFEAGRNHPAAKIHLTFSSQLIILTIIGGGFTPFLFIQLPNIL
ncbi:hypothetical protein CEXT_357591 [Caerostris extrusa]|uniref:Uncharacterized protein n=1 Tax=Caerostris extrusa TaxID=172846 RepID=A0AAV4NUR8_CAEEX|nr:hypothetical protein CEXT_357591 [Caerostris extrusa]